MLNTDSYYDESLYKDNKKPIKLLQVKIDCLPYTSSLKIQVLSNKRNTIFITVKKIL